MFLFSLLAFLLSVGEHELRNYDVNTTLGSHFLFAFSKLFAERKDVFFFLFSLSATEIEVVITTPWGEDASFSEQRTIRRLEVVTYQLSMAYMSDVEIGTKYSYRIEGQGQFGLIVFLASGLFQADSFTVLPVISWGKKYLAVTFKYFPSIQVVTNEGPNNVEIHLKITESDHRYSYEGSTYGNGDIFKFVLREHEAFSFSFCPEPRSRHIPGTLTGSLIEGVKPIGVISGDCAARTERFLCNTWNDSNQIGSSDVVVEMLMPVETYGRQFISIDIIGRQTPGEMVVVAAEPHTTVKIAHDEHSYHDIHLAETGDWAVLPFRDARAFSSNKVIQVVYYELSACLPATHNLWEPGDPATCVLVPVNLFFDYYVWSTPFSKLAIPTNYVAIVVNGTQRKDLVLDDSDLPDSATWHKVIGLEEWEVGNLQIEPGTHRLYTMHTMYFGCYIYGLARFYSYMNPAGYIAEGINQLCIPEITLMQPGDHLDNDCDGKIDEETANERDDDNDNVVDEDLVFGNQIAGHWGQWSEWVCHYQCYIHTEKRVRFCDDPAPANDGAECVGNSEDFKNSTCGQNLVCPLECPVGLWDFNCDKTCLTCSPDCDKFSGSCESCVAGYKFPESGCDTECGVNTFGPNCEGDCLQKCETDCVDRVEGTCPIVSNNMKYLLLIFLVVPVVGVILLLLRKKKELIVEEALVPFE